MLIKIALVIKIIFNKLVKKCLFYKYCLFNMLTILLY